MYLIHGEKEHRPSRVLDSESVLRLFRSDLKLQASMISKERIVSDGIVGIANAQQCYLQRSNYRE